MPKESPMRDIFARLKSIGFDADFLRRTVLPDWWDDSMAATDANRALAEIAIARHLGLEIAALRDTTKSIKLPALANARLKINKNVEPAEVAPAMWIAQHAAEVSVPNLRDMPQFGGRVSASEVRKIVLKYHSQVDLTALV